MAGRSITSASEEPKTSVSTKMRREDRGDLVYGSLGAHRVVSADVAIVGDGADTYSDAMAAGLKDGHAREIEDDDGGPMPIVPFSYLYYSIILFIP